MDIHFCLTVIYFVVLFIVVVTSVMHADTYRKLPSIAPFLWLVIAYKFGSDDSNYVYSIATWAALLQGFSSYGRAESILAKTGADIARRKSIFTFNR